MTPPRLECRLGCHCPGPVCRAAEGFLNEPPWGRAGYKLLRCGSRCECLNPCGAGARSGCEPRDGRRRVLPSSAQGSSGPRSAGRGEWHRPRRPPSPSDQLRRPDVRASPQPERSLFPAEPGTGSRPLRRAEVTGWRPPPRARARGRLGSCGAHVHATRTSDLRCRSAPIRFRTAQR